MKVVVLGANGQLGHDISSTFAAEGNTVTGLTHEHVEVASPESVKAALASVYPDLVINTAAFHHVEKCEADPGRAFAVNGAGARNVAQVTDQLQVPLIHISTDYVFDGAKRSPYAEDDQPQPLNVYGNTKLCGEHFVRSTNPRHFVVRVSAISGENPCRARS